MKVLVACEFSGTVRDAFIKRGHDAYSCDLLPCDTPGPHYQQDIIRFLNAYPRWDLIIAHPPCTYLCNSGVRWFYKKGTSTVDPERYTQFLLAADFFKFFLNYDCDKICIENPIPHGVASETIGKEYSQIVQPWMFGHPEKKSTCLWLKGLPLLKETNNVKEEMNKLSTKEQNRIHYMSPGKDRGKLRSKTYQGIADAMAEQWGSLKNL